MNWFSTEESVVKPEDFALKDLEFVKLGVIVFVGRVYDWMKAAASHVIMERDESIVGAKRFFATDNGLGVFHAYFGAPATVALAEALVASGIERIILFGEAGSISPTMDVGEILIPTFAIREEGVSYHYMPPDFEAKPAESLLNRIRTLLSQIGMPYKEGGVWTTDAPFRETMSKVLNYSRKGVLAVEMECSALFCQSNYRGIASAALLVITDTLWEGVWKPAFQEQKVVYIEKKTSEAFVTHWNKLI